MSYKSLLQSTFGNQHSLLVPYMYSIHLYCLLVVVIVVSASAYAVRYYRSECDQTFAERVRILRLKYAAGRADHD